MEVAEREEIEEEYRWSVDDAYGDGEWEREYDRVKQELEELRAFEGRATESGETLLELLELYSDIMRRLEKLSRYASMKSDEDTRKEEYQALSSKAQSLGAEASSASSFLEPEIQQLERERLEQMVGEAAELEDYRHYIDDILRMKPHTRSQEVENVLAELSDVLDASSDAYRMLANADMEFPSVDRDGEEVRITQANFTKLLRDKDRGFRREVYEKFYDRFLEFDNTIGSTFSKNIRKNVKSARIRNYSSAREAALYPSNVPLEVYDSLVSTIEDNLDVLHSHVELKREALGVDELGMHDVYMPMAGTESPEVSYDEAREHILEALKPLGDEYVSIVEKAFEERWIDVYENKGKRSGAYSGGAYDTKPFILMNYQNDISSMFTLAHELGHSIHSYMTKQNQPYIYSHYRIFVAEVASTVNEALLTEHLLHTVEDDEFRLHVLSHALEKYRGTLYRQTMFADFEQRVHEKVEAGEPLTSENVSGLYKSIKSEFYEPAVVDDRIAAEWMRIPHFYYNFYVFQYATGISAANALTEKILEDGPEDYLGFLRSGSSKYPIELLKDAGVDMTRPEPVEAAVKLYRDRLDSIRELV